MSNIQSVFRKKVSLQGPLERRGDQLVLAIPLDAGGKTLARYSKGIGAIEGAFLVVVVRAFLAEKLNVHEGSLVIVDNHEGKFRITRSPDND